ncbi:unnamed protein product [Cylicocyclus nassatus]|uniref:Uncharacterized protein n=1 Tax=Cylicocyclus nassatus TaxID=53992 RepID=A0AA36HG77_CYLNA|nr:unnamed protein product [Cylicocyclus nassatus]
MAAERGAGTAKQGSDQHMKMGEYCEQLRKWMNELHCWQSFHQYNSMMMAYQAQMPALQSAESNLQDGLRQRRGQPRAEQNDAADLRRLPAFVLPVPPNARDVAIIGNPNGPDLLSAQFTVASYVRRFCAEVIDFFFAFIIKLMLVYYLVELEIVDLSRFDKLFGNEADLQTLVDVTQELFPLELLGKLMCSFLEALCLSQSLFSRFSGQTPGKYVMGVRVIDCGNVLHVAGSPPNVVRVTGSVLISFRAAVMRSLLKNILINSLVPFSTVAFAFNFNRAIYDIVAKTISAGDVPVLKQRKDSVVLFRQLSQLIPNITRSFCGEGTDSGPRSQPGRFPPSDDETTGVEDLKDHVNMNESKVIDNEGKTETSMVQKISEEQKTAIAEDIFDLSVKPTTEKTEEKTTEVCTENETSVENIDQDKIASQRLEHQEAKKNDVEEKSNVKERQVSFDLSKDDALVVDVSEDLLDAEVFPITKEMLPEDFPYTELKPLESKEETLLFTDDRDYWPSPVAVRHLRERSDNSVRMRPSRFSIDNSCFDLGDNSTEASLAGTPIEKVFPKDVFASPNIGELIRKRFNHRSMSADDSTPKSSNTSLGVEDECSSPDVTSPLENDIFKTGGVTFALDTTESDGTSMSPVSSSELESPIDQPTVVSSPHPPLSLNSDRHSAGLPESLVPTRVQELRPSVKLQPNQSMDEMEESTSTTETTRAAPATSLHKRESSMKKAGRRYGNLRVIEVLRVRLRCIRGVHVTRPLYVVAKLDARDIHHSGALHFHDSPSYLDEFSFEGSVPFTNLHLVILEGSRAPGKAPRPIGRVTLHRAEVVNHSGRELSLPLRVVSKSREVTGQICIDIRRQGSTFGIRVVDHSGLNLKDPNELYLLVSRHPSKETKKLRIASAGHSSEWLEMGCDEAGPLALRMSLWQELLRGLSSAFHGQIRVDVDERWTNGPSKWFYLRPRHSDHQQEGKTASHKQHLGDVKLWMSYTADHVLPLENYSYLMTSIAASPSVEPFSASLISLLEHLPKVDLGHVARPIVQAMASTQELRPLLNALYAADIERCQDLNTLFRSHTLASKMLYELLKIYGHSYLLISLKLVIDKIYKERRCCEIDPSRLPQGESLDKNMTMLLSYFALVFSRVVESASRCPPPIKTVLSDLRKVVREKTGRADVELLALSSFLIMRFFAAAVLSPKSFGIKHEQPEPRVARTLVLLSKMLQRVANCCVSLHPLTTKEAWLSCVLEKVVDDVHRQAMSDFLDRVSLETNDPGPPSKSTAILKEGSLIECRSRSRPSWRPVLLQKRRAVMLTDSELIWQKSQEDISPKGSMLLSDIRSVTSDKKNSLIIKSDGRQVVFQASGLADAADWISAIERQRTRLRRRTTRGDLRDLYEGDIEREMESLHVLLTEHLQTLAQWQEHLETDKPLPEHCPPLPKSLDGSLYEGSAREAHRTTLSRTIAATIAATHELERQHEESAAVYIQQMNQKPGTKENPIGDDNYLLLKRNLYAAS